MYIHINTCITTDVFQDGSWTLNRLFSLRFLSVLQIYNEFYFKPILVTWIENQCCESLQPVKPKRVELLFSASSNNQYVIIWVEGSLIY